MEVREPIGHIVSVGVIDHSIPPADDGISVIVRRCILYIVKLIRTGPGVNNGNSASGGALIGEAMRQTFDSYGRCAQRGAVIDFFSRSGGKSDLRVVRGDFQSPQALGERIVAALRTAPVDGIGVVRSSYVSDRPCGSDSHIPFIRAHDSGDGSFGAG